MEGPEITKTPSDIAATEFEIKRLFQKDGYFLFRPFLDERNFIVYTFDGEWGVSWSLVILSNFWSFTSLTVNLFFKPLNSYWSLYLRVRQICDLKKVLTSRIWVSWVQNWLGSSVIQHRFSPTYPLVLKILKDWDSDWSTRYDRELK